jgi:hypothetical protein
MGRSHSRPQYVFTPPKVDPQFRDIGCIGLKKDDYSGDDAGKLAAPPFCIIDSLQTHTLVYYYK